MQEVKVEINDPGFTRKWAEIVIVSSQNFYI